MASARYGSIGSGEGKGATSGSGRRRAVRPAAAALLLAASGAVAALDALPDTEHLQWRGSSSPRALKDGSVLVEYVARTDATDETDASLSVGFVPRFGCSPLIGIRLAGALAAEARDALSDGDAVTLEIDGERVPMPIVIDVADTVTTLWLDEPAGARERFREMFDTGSRAELELPGERPVLFSLLGSRLSIAGTEAACLAHEPVPPED